MVEQSPSDAGCTVSTNLNYRITGREDPRDASDAWRTQARLAGALGVGLAGFEPATFGPPDRRANQAAPQPVDGRVYARARFRADG